MIQWISVDLVLNEELELAVEFEHEFGTGRDGIAIKQVVRLLALSQQLLTQHLRVLSTAESTRTLLIHLRARGHSVHCEEEDLARFDSVHDLIYGFHDVGPDLVEVIELAHALVQLGVVSVDAVVHDAVQVQI